MDSYRVASTVADADVETRAAFISRTYTTLFGAMLAFAGIEIYAFQSGLAERVAISLGGNWLLVLGGFILVSWLARSMAHRAKTAPVQYLGLGLFVLLEAFIFMPILYIADAQFEGVIQSAALITLVGFAALTAIAFKSRRDFSFLGPFLMWGGVVAMLLILGGIIFGFQLGMFFSVAMIALAGGSILYDTSNIIRHYSATDHVAAALELFSSVALMFWYVLRLLMGSNRD